MPRRLCLITGATAGIGQALARVYAESGWDLAITGRRIERLHALAEELQAAYRAEVYSIPADLSQPGAVDFVLGAIAAEGRVVDAVVNNAGYGVPGQFAATTWADQAAFLQVLVTVVAEMSHKVLPGMLERGYGRILNVASVAGLVPGQAGATLYCGAKSLVVRFSQSLRQETFGKGVHVTALCPGYTLTEFHDVAGTRRKLKGLPDWLWMDAMPVAAAGYRAVEANRDVRITGWPNLVIVALSRLLPDSWSLGLMRRTGSKLRPV